MTDVIPLDACEPQHVELVGGKAVGLGSLVRENVRVPPGFALNAHCYRQFVAHTGLASRICGLLAGADSLEAQTEASQRIRLLFEERELANGLRQDLARAYRDLGSEIAVAVRSSAIHEDSARVSFAGEHETYLWVTGADAVCRAVLRCWASLFTPHALAYFRRVDLRATDAAMGVVVQAMVPAEAAGVMLTVDPVTRDRLADRDRGLRRPRHSSRVGRGDTRPLLCRQGHARDSLASDLTQAPRLPLRRRTRRGVDCRGAGGRAATAVSHR